MLGSVSMEIVELAGGGEKSFSGRSSGAVSARKYKRPRRRAADRNPPPRDHGGSSEGAPASNAGTWEDDQAGVCPCRNRRPANHNRKAGAPSEVLTRTRGRLRSTRA